MHVQRKAMDGDPPPELQGSRLPLATHTPLSLIAYSQCKLYYATKLIGVCTRPKSIARGPTVTR
jgi:hypothetical protein